MLHVQTGMVKKVNRAQWTLDGRRKVFGSSGTIQPIRGGKIPFRSTDILSNEDHVEFDIVAGEAINVRKSRRYGR